MRLAIAIAALGAAISALGCAPVYRPSALNAPMHDRAGDVHVSGTSGSQGAQLHGSYAVTDYAAVRGQLQSYASSDSHFHHASTGASLYGGTGRTADPPGRGLRWALSLDGGLADARGAARVRMFGAESDRVHEGTVARAAAQGDFGYKGRIFSLGIGARASYLSISHGPGSDAAGERGHTVVFEPIVFLRPGGSAVGLDLQAGLALAPTGNDLAGVPYPLIFSVGVTVDP